MSKRRLTLSEAALTDILEQAEWYEGRSDTYLGKRWERAVSSALRRLVQRPHVGALCRFRSSELRDVRRMPVAGFSRHLIFYRLYEEELLVLRIVHGARDLESLFGTKGSLREERS